MFFDPQVMAKDLATFARALRTAPIQRWDEDSSSFAGRYASWRVANAHALEIVDNTPWVEEMGLLLSEAPAYNKERTS